MLSFTLERNDLAEAEKILEEMPEKTKTFPLTIFLMYKFSLQCEKHDIGKSTLQSANFIILI